MLQEWQIYQSHRSGKYKGVYMDLTDGASEKEKEKFFLSHINMYATEYSDFDGVPNTSMAYWLSQQAFISYVISKEDRKELGTAIGLFASGVGAGSYVYLRRILERLVYQAKETAGDVIDDEKFEQARMSERVKMLDGYLPEVLINNTTIYGILSKGIHELSEEECRKYFPVVKECIYQILGMWESLRKKQADEAALSKALSAITTSIK